MLEVLKEELIGLGVKRGDALLIHSQSDLLAKKFGSVGNVLDLLVDLVGPSGTVVIPSFTIKPWEGPHHGPTFDPKTTVEWTGALSFFARRRKDFVRSIHPTHSVVAYGELGEHMVREHELSITPFDAFSPFAYLAKHPGAKSLTLGCDPWLWVMYHYCEEQVGTPTTYHNVVNCGLKVNGEEKRRHYMLHHCAFTGRPAIKWIYDFLLTERGLVETREVDAMTVSALKIEPTVRLVVQMLRMDPQILFKARSPIGAEEHRGEPS